MYTTALLVHKGVLAGTAVVKGVQTVIEYAHAKALMKSAVANGVNTASLTVANA